MPLAVRSQSPNTELPGNFKWQLNCITAKAPNSAEQRQILERKAVQSNAEATEGSTLVEDCYVSLKSLKL